MPPSKQRNGRSDHFPIFRHLMRWLAAALGELGRTAEAKAALEKAITVRLTRSTFRYANARRYGHHRRSRFKPNEQPSDWFGRCHCQPKCRCPPAGDKRDIDRRRSWPQSLCDGFARDNPVANRLEARRGSCDSVAVPETWNCCHASSIGGRTIGNHGGVIVNECRPLALFGRRRSS